MLQRLHIYFHAGESREIGDQKTNDCVTTKCIRNYHSTWSLVTMTSALGHKQKMHKVQLIKVVILSD